jgi:hypothetical protein
LLAPNGLDKIKQELKKLLYGSNDLATRYDEFRKNVKGFGPSSLTEILHFVFPDRCCLWNIKPKTVISYLELNILPDRLFKYGISSGKEHLQCINALRSIRDELKDFNIKDFIDLDIFFWHVFDDVIPTKAKRPLPIKTKKPPIMKPIRMKIDSHEGAEYVLLELGRMLDYLTYTVDQAKKYKEKRLGEVSMLQQVTPYASERDMVPARQIDVIWFDENENPTHCFEVEHSTDIIHGLNRLITLQHLYVKFFVIAPEERRSKFESLLQRIPFRRISDRFSFISYEELASLYEYALPFHNLKIQLLGE